MQFTNLRRRLRATWHPDEYHGWGRSRRYFEGWYFKMVSADERHAFAFIPGIAMSETGERHAFVQVMDGKACQAQYHRFAAEAFVPTPGRFEVAVGKNLFSGNEIRLDLPGIRKSVSRKLHPGRVCWALPASWAGTRSYRSWSVFTGWSACFTIWKAN
jgi:tocopherol cyclase